jgi:hypothetical protein
MSAGSITPHRAIRRLSGEQRYTRRYREAVLPSGTGAAPTAVLHFEVSITP